MVKPVLLLDVDGVIAPFGVRPEHINGHIRRDIHDSYGIVSVYMREDLPEIIQELIQHYKIVWATAWEEKANIYLLEHMGLEDPIETLRFTMSVADFVYESWKLPSIVQWGIDNEVPCVWVDDEPRDDAFTWAQTRSEEGIPTKVLRVDPGRGLTDEVLNELLDWAKEIKVDTKA